MLTELVLKVLQYLQPSHSQPQRPLEADTQQTKLVIAPELPVVATLDCGGGGSILASEGLRPVREAVDQDWRALECIKANGLDNGARLLRVTTGPQEYLSMLREVRPDVVVGDACRRFKGLREKEGVSGASSLAQAAIASDARVLYSSVWATFCERRNGTTTFSLLWNESHTSWTKRRYWRAK